MSDQDTAEKLEYLERIARRLDPPADERERLLRAATAYARGFLDSLPGAKTYVPDPGPGAEPGFSIREAAAEPEELLEFISRAVDTTGINPASGGQLGYIPGGGLFPSAVGDFLADVSNRYSGVAFAGPGAARMELSLVDWMCRMVGYPDTAGGDLTSGGSLATLSAIVTAREARLPDIADIPRSCIYLTEQAHHCIGKALRVAGLSSLQRRVVPMDARYRMDAGALAGMLSADRARGLNPWLVVATAGTTDTGAVDPVAEIAALAQEHGLWLHLDAAYGGFFLLCEEGRAVLKGFEQADSIVMDPHKGLFLPYGSGAVLVRDARLLAAANAFDANYMQDTKQQDHGQGGEPSPADYSLELSRPFRGLRLWLPLKLFGLEPFRAALSEKIRLACYFHRALSETDGFEVGPAPDLSVVTYRYQPRSGDADDFNRRLLAAVLEDGRVFLSSTMIDGRFTLRLAVLNFRTHREQVDYVLDLLRRKARELDAG